MEIVIGGRALIESATLLVPEDEDAWVEFVADTWRIKLHIIFVTDPSKGDAKVNLEPRDDHGLLTFYNWDNALASATAKPFRFGETAGRHISLLITGHAIQKFRHVTLSFFWEN